jgi:hypothetical protein
MYISRGQRVAVLCCARGGYARGFVIGGEGAAYRRAEQAHEFEGVGHAPAALALGRGQRLLEEQGVREALHTPTLRINHRNRRAKHRAGSGNSYTSGQHAPRQRAAE